MDCSEGTLKDDVCLTQIKTQFQNFPQETKEITELLCNQKNSSNACFELGASYVKGGDYESALQPYTQACALGHPTACNVLGPLQGNIKINDYRKFENAKISIEQNRENRELANERVKAVQKISESLQKGYQPPQKTKCRNGLEAGTIECETN